MKSYLFWIQNFLGHYCELLNISILIFSFDEGGVIKAWDIIFGFIGAFPFFFGNDLFGLIVDIVNRRAFYFSINKEKSAEHGNGT